MKKTVGVLTAVVASAVVSFASPGRALPDTANSPAAPPTLQIEPASLVIHTLFPMHFEEKDGVLALKDLFQGVFSGTKPPDPTLWSDQFINGSRHLTLAATDFDESLQDEQGKTLWSKQMDKPDLTLTLDPNHNAILSNGQGTKLWAGHLPLSYRASIAALRHDLPADTKSYTTNYFQYLYTKQNAVLQDGDEKILWSGQPAHNTGLLIRDPQGQRVIGLQRPFLLPPNTLFQLDFTTAPLTVTLSDQQRHIIDTRQIMAITLNVSAKEADPQGAALVMYRYGFDSGLQQMEEVDPPSVGTFYADYRNAQGDLVRSEQISVTDVHQQTRLSGVFINFRQISRKYVDNLGRHVTAGRSIFAPPTLPKESAPPRETVTPILI